MRKKFTKILTMIFSCLFIFTGQASIASASVLDSNDVVGPMSTQVCSVHGYAHKKDASNGYMFAFSEGGTRYTATEFYCQCGAHVSVTAVNGGNYYWYTGYKVWGKNDPYHIGAWYLVPDPAYNGKAPGWDYYN